MPLAGVLDRFGAGSARRARLAECIRALLRLARESIRVHPISLWSNFVAAKPSENDPDVLQFWKAVLDHERDRPRTQADVFWVREDIREHTIESLRESYQPDRDRRRRGSVEVIPWFGRTTS